MMPQKQHILHPMMLSSCLLEEVRESEKAVALFVAEAVLRYNTIRVSGKC